MADQEKISILELDINADDAAKKLADLNLKMIELKNTTSLTYEEVEINKAKLKALSQEYQSTQKVLVGLTQLKNQELGTLQKLSIENKNLRTEQQKLNLTTVEGSKRSKEINLLLNKNTDFIRKNSDAAKQQAMNIGNYPKLLEQIPGPAGRAASSISGVVSKLKTFGPVGALIGGGLLAISAPLVAFFTKSEKGVELLERKVAGFKAAISVLTGELIGAGDRMVSALDKPEKKVGTFYTKFMALIGGIGGPASIAKMTAIGISMDQASLAAEKYTAKIQELDDAERALIVPRAEANRNLVKAKELYMDETKTIDERRTALMNSINIEEVQATKEKLHQSEVVKNIGLINEEKKKAGQLRDEDLLKYEQAKAKEIDLDTESTQRKFRNQKALIALNKEYIAEINKRVEAVRNAVNQELAIEDYYVAQDKLKSDQKFANDEAAANLDVEKSRNKRAIDAQNRMDLQLSSIGNEYDLHRQQLINDRELELSEAKKTGANVLLIKEKYANYEIALDKEVRDAKLQTLGDYVEQSGSILDSFYANDLIKLENKNNAELSIEGLTSEMKSQINEKYIKKKDEVERKQFNIAKIVGIAKATLNAYVAVSDVFEAEPGELITKSIAAGIALAEGLAIVAKIRKVNIGSTDTGGGGGSSNISSGVAGSFSSVPKTPAQLSFAGSDVLQSRSNNRKIGFKQPLEQPVLVIDALIKKQNSDRIAVETSIG